MKPRFRKRKSLAQGHPAGHGKYCQTLGHPGQDAREATKRPHRVSVLSVSCPVRQGLTPRNLPIPETCVHLDLHPTGALSTASPPGSYWALCLPELSPRPALG